MNTERKSRRLTLGVAAASACVALLTHAAGAAVSTNVSLDINALVGADAFYNRGYTGSRAVAVVIESTHPWNGHETLGHVTTFIRSPSAAALVEDANYVAWAGYNTGVAGLLGGRPPAAAGQWHRGIAHGAELWSGSVASEILTPNRFAQTLDSLRYPYYTSLSTGVEGRTADVAFSGFADTSVPHNGLRFARIVDALASETGKTIVIQVGSPALPEFPEDRAWARPSTTSPPPV